MIIGYLGPSGSFSESACQQLWPADTERNYMMFESLEVLYNALCKQEIDIAVMPTWNSVIGLLKRADGQAYYSQLEPNQSLQALSSLELPLNFCLLTSPNMTIADIHTLHVNPYAQAICADWLTRHPQWKIVVHNSSSQAAKTAAQHSKHHAALASSSAAKQYGLHILQQDVATSRMLFVSLAKITLPTHNERLGV